MHVHDEASSARSGAWHMSVSSLGTVPPVGLRCSDTGNHLEITRRWNYARPLYHALFLLVIFGILLNISSRMIEQDSVNVARLLAILAALSLAVYWSVASLLNRTRILVNLQSVSLKHEPLWWPGNKKIDSWRIRHLFFHESLAAKSHQRPGFFLVKRYEVRAILNTGKNIAIAKNLNTRDQALFIKDTINRYLRIREDPVPEDSDRRYA